MVKNLPVIQETRLQSLGRKFPKENGNPLQYSHLENYTDSGAWRATANPTANEVDMTERLTLSHCTMSSPHS